MFTVHYSILFVGGTLKDLRTVCQIKYPKSSRVQIYREFTQDCAQGIVFYGSGTSSYIITDFWIEDQDPTDVA